MATQSNPTLQQYHAALRDLHVVPRFLVATVQHKAERMRASLEAEGKAEQVSTVQRASDDGMTWAETLAELMAVPEGL